MDASGPIERRERPPEIGRLDVPDEMIARGGRREIPDLPGDSQPPLGSVEFPLPRAVQLLHELPRGRSLAGEQRDGQTHVAHCASFPARDGVYTSTVAL